MKTVTIYGGFEAFPGICAHVIRWYLFWFREMVGRNVRGNTILRVWLDPARIWKHGRAVGRDPPPSVGGEHLKANEKRRHLVPPFRILSFPALTLPVGHG